MNTLEKSMISGFILTILFSFSNFYAKCETINNKILRLHILANSDSNADQDLKIKVRDRILLYSNDNFTSAKSKEEAKSIFEKNLDAIEQITSDEIRRQGYDYPVKTELVNMHFNTRQYNDIMLPAGNYDALRVVIGAGEGHNWWCVMFPPLCLGSCTEKKNLEPILNKSELNIVSNKEKYKIKFKSVEIFESIKAWLSRIF